MADDSTLRDALALEENRFFRFASEANAESEKAKVALHNRLAARGTFNSGMRHSSEMEIFFNRVRTVAEKMIALRRELGATLPSLLTERQLEALGQRLHRDVDGAVRSFRERLSSGPLRPDGALRDSLLAQSEQIAAGIKARIKSEIHALGLEARLGLHTGEHVMTNLNVSNSTIGNLNLGSVIGNITASVQVLQNANEQELAASIRQLAEAIAESESLRDQRKDLLEQLAVVSDEASRPAEQRRLGAVKVVLANPGFPSEQRDASDTDQAFAPIRAAAVEMQAPANWPV